MDYTTCIWVLSINLTCKLSSILSLVFWLILARLFRCATCHLDYFKCPGHPGHIELPVPVLNPLLAPYVYQLLRCFCHFCHRFRMSRLELTKFMCRLKLTRAGLLKEALELDNMFSTIEAWNEADETLNEAEEVEEGDKKVSTQELEKDVIARVIQYTDTQLQHQSTASIVDSLKENMNTTIYAETVKLTSDFFRHAIGVNKCVSCGGASPKFRKEGWSKLFQLPLPAKAQRDNHAKRLYLTDVISGKRNHTEHDENESDTEDVNDQENVLDGKHAMDASKKATLVTTQHIKRHIELLFDKEQEILDLLFVLPQVLTSSRKQSKTRSHASASMFFLEVIPVTPNKFRPAVLMNEQTHEHPQNVHLSRILNGSQRIRELNARIAMQATEKERLGRENASELPNDKASEIDYERYFADLVQAWVQLQTDVNCLIDSERPGVSTEKTAPAGIKQILEKKEGLFRKHMMGKRVNYAARSVISPDPNLETSEIGIPIVFATKLTYPEPVTPFNVKRLRQAVINGNQWPGAAFVQSEDGHLLNLVIFCMFNFSFIRQI